jgi:hypothetical protein
LSILNGDFVITFDTLNDAAFLAAVSAYREYPPTIEDQRDPHALAVLTSEA